MAVSVTAILQGGVYLSNHVHPTIAHSVMGLIAVAAAALVLVGLLTPVSATLAGIGIIGTEVLRLRESTPMLLDTKSSEILVLTIAAAIVFLGPGAFSLDARLFGRREIIIPPSSRLPKP